MSPLVYDPTQFMLDFEAVNSTKQETLEDYIKREPNYDVAFCQAWKIFQKNKDKKLDTPDQFLKLLDEIQMCALSHLPEYTIEKMMIAGELKSIAQPKQGKAPVNHYGLSPNTNSDTQGICDIIEKIWIEKDDCILITKDDNLNERYVLQKDTFSLLLINSSKMEVIYKNDESSQKTISKIAKKLISLYQKGICSNGSDRMILYLTAKINTRERKAKLVARHYLTEIKKLELNEPKIELIAKTIRDLMQIHLYQDGNGRSLYILANLLLYQNQLKLFYPRNICLFDGNSIERMAKEITEGQDRFSLFFGDEQRLSEGLNHHNQIIKKRKDLT